MFEIDYKSRENKLAYVNNMQLKLREKDYAIKGLVAPLTRFIVFSTQTYNKYKNLNTFASNWNWILVLKHPKYVKAKETNWIPNSIFM